MAAPELPSSNSILESSSSSKLTSSDKLSELPVSVSTPGSTPNNRAIRSQSVRAFRRSLDSLPSFNSTGETGRSPRISQAWGTIPESKSFPQVSAPDGNETPKQRVSFDSDRPQVFGRPHRQSDPPAFDSASPSRSRAASPLRIFQHLSAGFRLRNGNRTDDPFIPINPFEISVRLPCLSIYLAAETEPDSSNTSFEHIKFFITDTVPRQLYLYLLLCLPSTYFSRVARIFEDADVSRPDIERMIDAGMSGDALDWLFLPTASVRVRESLAASARATPVQSVTHLPEEWTPAVVSPALIRFKHSWEDFIGSLIKEWKTLNVVSALLLSAILTMFQIPPVASDPVTRTTALLSLVSALMSLCYGCVYIVRFSTMGSMYRASKFAEEARKTDTFIWWNVWTLLAMPAVSLAWSVVFFITSITSFVWRTGSILDPEERHSLGAHSVLVPRIAVTLFLLLGLLYFGLIIATLRRYGQGRIIRAGAGQGDAEAEAQTGTGTGMRGRATERTRQRAHVRDVPLTGFAPTSTDAEKGLLGAGAVTVDGSGQTAATTEAGPEQKEASTTELRE